jgi:hypothetical protein
MLAAEYPGLRTKRSVKYGCVKSSSFSFSSSSSKILEKIEDEDENEDEEARRATCE